MRRVPAPVAVSCRLHPLPDPRRTSHLRFWALLVQFLAVNWLIARFFQWVVRACDLNNAARTYYSDIAENGFGPAVGNLVLNWIPQALLVCCTCWVFLRLVHADPRAALTLRVRKSGAWLIPTGMLLLLLYQLAVRHDRFDADAARGGCGLAFIGAYTLRFLPSALVEEMVFRGTLFASLERRYGAWVGFAVSVPLFGLAHLYGGWWLFANALILGSGFTLVDRRTRSLGVVTILHLFGNVTYACLNYLD